MKSLLIKIGIGVSLGVNLFIFSALLYNLKMYDKRVDENRKFIKDTIVEEVYRQMTVVMPKQSGGVIK